MGAALAVAAGLLVAGCGGGGGGAPVAAGASPDTAGTAVVTSNTVSGSVVKGPVSGATVCAYTLVAAGKGDRLACTTSKADGSYDLQLTYTGPVLVEATGGTYTDEATGTANVPLAETLRAVGTVAPTGASVVPTPLTELAVRKALANGGLSDELFKAAAAEVATAFGLGSGVDIAKTLPTVSGQVNTYGSALIGVSRMLAKGATLGGILANGDLAALKAGYQQATSSACNLPSSQQLVSAPAANVDFTVLGPQPAWRSLLPVAGGTAMGCTVTANTAQEVKLSCPSSALGTLTIQASDKASAVTTLPGAGVLIVGDGIAAGDITAVAGAISFTDAAGAAIPSAAALMLDTNATLNLGNGLALGGTGSVGGGGQVQLCTLAANGGVSSGSISIGGGSLSTGGGGTITTGGGSLTIGGGTLPVGGGNVTLGGGSLTTTGGTVVTTGTGTLTLSSGNAWTGPITVSAGTLTVSSATTLGVNGTSASGGGVSLTAGR